MPEISLRPLFAHQYKSIELLETYDIVGQYGTRGSGKSECIDQGVIQECLLVPGNACPIIRRRLEDAAVDDRAHFLKACPPELIIDTKNMGQSPVIYIRPIDWNGKRETLSQVIFMGVISDGKQQPDNVKGEFGAVFFPELSELEENVFLQAITSCRMPVARRKVLAAFNPVHRLHWIKKYFPAKEEIESECFYIDEGKDSDNYGKIAYPPLSPDRKVSRRSVHKGGFPGYVSVWSKTTDNKALPEDYIQRTYGNMPSSWLAKFVDGKTGADPDGRGVFEQDFRSDIHVVPVEPEHNLIVRSYDADLHPGITWGQYVQNELGLWERHTFLEATGYGVRYDNFLAEAFERQNELFGFSMKYKDCGDPALRAEDARSKKSYLDILEVFGVTDVDLADGLVLNSKAHRVLMMKSWMKVDSETSRYKVHPRCEVLIEGFETGYKNRFNQTIGKLVMEPVKDPFYSAVQDCEQYSAVNYSDLHGNVTIDDQWQAPEPRQRPERLVNTLHRRRTKV